MDKLTIISGCLFLAADIFAIASLANPDWINTGESAGEGASGAGGCRCPVPGPVGAAGRVLPLCPVRGGANPAQDVPCRLASASF